MSGIHLIPSTNSFSWHELFKLSFVSLPSHWLCSIWIRELWASFSVFTCIKTYTLKLRSDDFFLVTSSFSLLPVRLVAKLNIYEGDMQLVITFWYSNIGRYLWDKISNTPQIGAQNTFRGLLDRKNGLKCSQKHSLKTNPKIEKKFFFSVFSWFLTFFSFFFPKKNHFSQKSRFYRFLELFGAICQRDRVQWPNFFPRCSPCSILDSEKNLDPYESHRWLHNFFAEKKVSDQVAGTLEKRLTLL